MTKPVEPTQPTFETQKMNDEDYQMFLDTKRRKVDSLFKILGGTPHVDIFTRNENFEFSWLRNGLEMNNYDLLMNEFWKGISMGYPPSMSYLLAHKHLPWDWEEITSNVSFQDIADHPELPWNNIEKKICYSKTSLYEIINKYRIDFDADALSQEIQEAQRSCLLLKPREKSKRN